MSKPTTPTWDTNGTHLVAVTAGHKSDGLIVDEVPGSGEENSWRKGLCDFLAWQDGDEFINRYPLPSVVTAWANAASGDDGSTAPTLKSTGAGQADIDLLIDVNKRLKTFTMGIYGNAAANLTVALIKFPHDATAYTTLVTYTLTAPAAAWNDRFFRFDAHTTSGLTVTVANDGGGNGQYTRSAGNFLTEGFYIGQVVTWAGFSNAGNNVSTTITALSATVMDTNNATYVAEGPAGSKSVAATALAAMTVDTTYRLGLRLTSSAIGINVRAYRLSTDKPA